MPTLIYYDEALHQQALSAATDVASQLTALLAQYQALGLPDLVPTPATADLPGLMEDPEGWLLDKYLSGFTPMLGGLELDRQKALELLKRPAGFPVFVNEAKELARHLAHVRRSGDAKAMAGVPLYYEVGNGGQVALTGEAAIKMEESFKSYATTAAQEVLLAKVQALAAAVNTFRAGTKAFGLKDLLSDALQETGTTVRVKADFIIYHAR